MKILMVARRFPPDVQSGTETVFANLYRRACQNHEVRLVAGYSRERSFIPEEALGVDLRGWGRGGRHLRLWQVTRWAIRRFKPDVVLSNSIEAPAVAHSAFIVHDLNFGRARPRLSTRMRELLYRWRRFQLPWVIAPSEATRQGLLDLGYDPTRVEVIHNGVDLAAFQPRERTGGETVRLCYPGRILPGKGQHLAVDAIARLRPEEKGLVHLDIAGAVTDRVYFNQLRVAAHGQPISFHPDVDDIVPFYQRADLVLFPTLMREGFGYTAVEAMACGRPVVFSDQPGIREATGGIGVPVQPRDPLALQAAIRQYLADPKPFDELGRKGRAFVESHYDWERVWDHYEERLMKLALNRH
ncbi:MAG: glycosyltransferase family 4 protein [Proteobacteria bacterium]|nr:glycosyltransferase family 4 protein [Pseudomonadota bacterium]